MASRTVITEQTTMLMPLRIRRDPSPLRSVFKLTIHMDYLDPNDQEQRVQSYSPRSCKVGLVIPSTYHNFVCECRFRVKQEFGLLRHVEVCSKSYTLLVCNKQDKAKENMPITEETWDRIQTCLKDDNQICSFILKAQTKKEPWSLDYEFDSDSGVPYPPGPNAFRNPHYTLSGRRRSDTRERSKSTQGWNSSNQYLIYERQESTFDNVKVDECNITVAEVDEDAVIKDDGWIAFMLRLFGGSRKRKT